MISRPQVLMKEDEDGEKLEPYEKVVFDVPTESTGAVTEAMGTRKGFMKGMAQLVKPEQESSLKFLQEV